MVWIKYAFVALALAIFTVYSPLFFPRRRR
jgi:hypothetical protein